MNTNLNFTHPLSPDLFRALEAGDLSGATEIIRAARASDPKLKDLAEDLIRSYWVLRYDPEPSPSAPFKDNLSDLRLSRQLTVLSWFELEEQLRIVNCCVETDDMCLPIIECFKWGKSVSPSSQKALSFLIARCLARQQFNQADALFQRSGWSLRSLCEHPAMAYKQPYAEGWFCVQNMKDVPFYCAVLLNYTPEFLTYVLERGVTPAEVSALLPLIDNLTTERHNQDVITEYLQTTLPRLQSQLEKIALSVAVCSQGTTSKKKM